MSAIIVTVLIAGFGYWLTLRVLPIFEAKWKAENDLAKRYASVAEREIALAEQRAEKPSNRQPMPADLLARIAAWEDEFAREDERKYVEQLYAEMGDWDAVRRAYAPSLADNQPAPQVMG